VFEVLGQSIEITRSTYKLENMSNAILAWSLVFMISTWILISFGSSSTTLFQIETAAQKQGNSTSVLTNDNNNTITKANTANNNLINKGIALLIVGKYNEAINLFDKVLALEPNNTLALTNKGAIVACLQKYD
jgi:tetratricopeptide (TPR) repeat protein